MACPLQARHQRPVVYAEEWTLLRWRMTEAGAAEWAGNNDCEIEKIPDSGETLQDF